MSARARAARRSPRSGRVARLACLLAAAALAVPSASFAAAPRMNVLWVTIDDLNTRAVGAYGEPLARTPHLDRLAAQGLRFTRAYVQAPLCAASRASMLSGLRPDSTRVYTNLDSLEAGLSPDAPLVYETLHDSGFLTLGLGKILHQLADAPSRAGALDRIGVVRPPADFAGSTALPEAVRLATARSRARTFRYSPDAATEARLGALAAQVDAHASAHGVGSEEHAAALATLRRAESGLLGPSGLDDVDHNDGRVARHAAHFLREEAAERQPFLLQVGLTASHVPLSCPAPHHDAIDGARVDLDRATRRPAHETTGMRLRRERRYDLFERDPSPAEAREAVRSYLACASFVDAQLGLVLEALAESGLGERTIVIVVSDHGFHLGEHELWSKYTLYEPVTRVPLIVRVPGRTAAGSVSDAIVELVDLFPTLCELLGIAPPAGLEGTSFVPLLSDPDRPWKRAAFSTLRLDDLTARSIRTRRHRYTVWSGPHLVERELYDLEADPGEERNLAGSSRHAATLAELDAALHAGWPAARPRDPAPGKPTPTP